MTMRAIGRGARRGAAGRAGGGDAIGRTSDRRHASGAMQSGPSANSSTGEQRRSDADGPPADGLTKKIGAPTPTFLTCPFGCGRGRDLE
ncbi:MAG: hypothetical protein AVDCRST_MAG19-1763 [uncultured Thermomicrobiales bacterium]|uniref:Uncharacterized protein n=1 Tax=uncultured Thermomicrobiales bacterium TaxID=1645740 RepID=A0A6J4UX67_9BACT|nr:MAG: hypothetical protein AVDCRST_MAG19-1763 [uncultured Thermomicrobiales bacterium]